MPAAFTAHTGAAHWHLLLRARAIEDQAWVVAPAQWGKHNEKRESYGHTLIVDPWGTLVAEQAEGDGVVVATLDGDDASRSAARRCRASTRRALALKSCRSQAGNVLAKTLTGAASDPRHRAEARDSRAVCCQTPPLACARATTPPPCRRALVGRSPARCACARRPLAASSPAASSSRTMRRASSIRGLRRCVRRPGSPACRRAVGRIADAVVARRAHRRVRRLRRRRHHDGRAADVVPARGRCARRVRGRAARCRLRLHRRRRRRTSPRAAAR